MSVKHKIKALRPKLKTVAPLTFWICMGFGLVNVSIWALLVTADPTRAAAAQVPTAPNYTWFAIWAYWFLFLGLGMFVSLYKNRWDWIKSVLIGGLVSKLIWTYSLIFMIFNGYPTFSTLILWSFLAWVQAWTIVFFVPTIADDRHDILPENKGDLK